MNESNRFLGIAYLYTIITAIFLLASYLPIFFYYSIDKYDIKAFLLQFCFCAAIWFVLYLLNKKQNQRLDTIFKDIAIRKTAGILIMVNGLISLSNYFPSVVYAVSLIIHRKLDDSVVMTLVSLIFILIQIVMGLFLFKYKNNTSEKYCAGTIIGITYLYSLITVVCSFIFNFSLNKYFLLRLPCPTVILIVLYLLNKKRHQNLNSVFFNDTTRKSVGILIIIDGIMSLSVQLNTVINIIWLLNSPDRKHAISGIPWDIMKFVIVACKIGSGVYLLRYKKDEHYRKQ